MFVELEALKVVEVALDLACNNLLAPSRFLPFGNNIIFGKSSFDGLGEGCAVDVEAEGGEGNPFHTDDLAGNIRGGAINDDLG